MYDLYGRIALQILPALSHLPNSETFAAQIHPCFLNSNSLNVAAVDDKEKPEKDSKVVVNDAGIPIT